MTIINKKGAKKMKIDKYMNCLAIEMTRHCNMDCKFCGKGQAQNLDISKEIIDKTLDEMEGVYIETLRISGGEPLLKPNLISYLIEKIIEKHIYINNIYIFTNGNVKTNLELSYSILKLLNYLRDIEPEIRNIIRWSDSTTEKIYAGTYGSKFNIIVSDHSRQTNQRQIDNIINFFHEQIKDEDFSIVRQSDSYNSFGCITLEGNAAKNYKVLLNKEVSLSDIRILNNNYYFMAKSANLSSEPFFKDTVFIRKTLTVSANGNVFPGCLMSYERVDSNPMFNIMECNKDFYKRVNKFCWEHPINEKALNIRNKFSAIEFCKKHNILVKDMSKLDFEGVRLLNNSVNEYERIAKDTHLILPNLNFTEIDLLSSTILSLNMFEKNIPVKYIQIYLKWCTNFDDNTISNISAEWCRGLISFLSEKNNKTA